jgi:ferritin
MLKKAVEAALNDQIQMELESAYIYLGMAAYAEQKNLPGFAHWMRMQWQEEIAHAMKMFDFIHDRGGKVALKSLSRPPASYSGPLDVMKKTLKHEQKVTASITKLYELALKEKDYPSQILLQWFIDEQTEEEKAASDIIAQLEMAGDSGAGLVMVDRELAGRAAGAGE